MKKVLSCFTFLKTLRFQLLAALLTATLFLLATNSGYFPFPSLPNPLPSTTIKVQQKKPALLRLKSLTTTCGSLQSANIGSVTGSATYDACDSDTITISANNVPSSTADKQYSVQREVCGDGEVIVNVLSVSGGLAGLELRESNAAGSVKIGLRTVLSTFVQRFYRSSTNASQTSQNANSVNHKWLKLVRSGSNVSMYTSTTGSSWNLVGSQTVSLPNCVQATLFMQSINVNSTHTGIFKALQFTSFTEPAGDPTTVSFDQDTINANAGDTVMVCVNIANPCECSPTEVDVALDGSGAPHLSNFTTQTLVFDDTTTQQCFFLPILDAAGSDDYILTLENVSGGNGAESGTPENLVIAVTGVDEGSPLHCGVAPLMTGEAFPDEIPIAFDRFGNQYVYSQLLPPSNTSTSSFMAFTTGEGFEGCGCGDLGIDLELFTLWFEDCAFETASGFAVTGQDGEDRRRVMCAAFQYLEDLITPNTSVCDPNTIRKVNVRIQPSVSVANYYNEVLNGFTNNQTLGYASPYFPRLESFNPGIKYPLPQIIFATGEYPPLIPQDGMHGMIRINFNHTWHLNYTSTTMPTSTEDDPLYDLFTASLHEAMHMLGFASSFTIPEDLQGSTSGVGSYFSFDRFLQLDQSGGQRLIVNDLPSPSDDFPRTAIWRFNPSINNPATEMFQSCLGGTTAPDMEFIGADNYYIFTGSAFLAGTSFSHLEDACDSEPDLSVITYVMRPFLPRSVARRELHEDEIDIMGRIGYAIGEDDCSAGSVADGNDQSCGMFDYTLEICPPTPGTLCIPLASLVENDRNAAEIAYIYPLLGSGTGELNEAGTHYEFTTSHPGIATLAYAILGCDGELGNTSIISINVVLASDDPDCLFYCQSPVPCEEFPEATECHEWGSDCEALEILSPCNLVCNPDLCGTAFKITPAGSLSDYESTTFRPTSEPAPIIPGWTRVGGKAGTYAKRFLDDDPFFHIGGNSDDPTQIRTFVPIEADKTYFFKFICPELSPSNSDGFLTLDLIKGEDVIPGPYSGFFGATLAMYDGPVLEIFDQHLGDDENIVEKFASCFSVPASEWQDYSAILLTSPGIITFDKFELIEDNFTAGPDAYTVFCSEPVPLGGGLFCMISDVEVEYEWLRVESDGQGGETLIEIGSYRTLNGEVVDNTITGNIDPVTLEITVAPGQTTAYRLRRTVYDAGGLPATFDFCKTEPDGTVTTDCNKEDDVTVFVAIPYPNAEFSFNENVCRFDFTSSEGMEDLTHEWDFGSLATPSTSTDVNPENILLPVGTHTVTHTVTGVCGVETHTEEISVDPSSNAEFTFNESVCRFNFTSMEGMEDLTHAWDFGSLATPSTSTDVNPEDILLPVGTHTVTHTVTGVCGTDTYSEEISVTPGSNAEFTFNESVCRFAFTSMEGMEYLTHAWDFGSLATPPTSTDVNPEDILLPVGTHTVTHTITGACGTDTYSEEISVTPDLNAVLTLVSEECGLVTFSISGLLPGDTWEIDYGDGNTDESLLWNYTLTPNTYTATLLVTNACGTFEMPDEVEVEVEGCPELDCCPNTSSMLLNNTSISEAIETGLPSGGTSMDLCIEGTLTIDEDYTFSGNLFMGPNARIVVTPQATLELDGAHLQGCEFLWQGIQISQPHTNDLPSLISHNETLIEDAKSAISAANEVLLDIKETSFNRNFIGLFLDDVPLSGFYGNIFDCTDVLKPSFSSAPNIGDYSYAGILSQSAPLHIGVAGAAVNTFQNLRNGIINTRGPLTVENSVFYNFEKALDEPYNITGYGIYHRGTNMAPLDQRGLGHAENAALTFDKCYTAIWVEKSNVTVRFNRMVDVHTGVQAQYCKNSNIYIDHNLIECYGIGLSLLQNDPANTILVWENQLHVNENSSTNAAGTGIFVQENGSQQLNAIIEQNPIYLYRKDKGIFLNTTKGYTVRDNDVFLESATVNEAMGISMKNSTLSRVSCNDILGVGKGNGLVSEMTSTTLYSCNTVENLSIGVSFEGASSSTYLQTTEFVPPLGMGLLYKANIVMMPPQIQKGNRWNTGTYGVAAVHDGAGTPTAFNEQRFEIHTNSAPYYPPSISVTGASPSAWFVPTSISPFLICNPTVECPMFGFAPDKDEVKSREEQLAEDEFADEWPGGMHWAAQWQLYEMLKRSPGIKDSSTVMATYYTDKATGALGRLHALQQDIEALFQILPEEQATLQEYGEQIESLMQDLALADSIAVHAPLLATPGLPQQLLAQCDSLLALSETLVEEILEEQATIIASLNAENVAIADTPIYIINEQVVNGIYLSSLLQDSVVLDTIQADSLYAIAIQCPETGGPAVYRARSLYALFAIVDFDAIECQEVNSLQSLPQQASAQLPDKKATFRVFPNPNQGRFNVEYQLEQDGMLVLTDVLGRQTITMPLSADSRRKQISVSELTSGLYYLHIVSGNSTIVHNARILIMH